MQFQVQTLINKDETSQKDMDNLDLFVGLHSPLESPYNIFLRLSDLESNSDIIYFYAYSMGKQRVIIWGLYDRSNNEFVIDNSCKYHPNDLKIVIDTWKNNKYEYFFTAMKDRKHDRINQYITYEDDRDKMITLINDFKEIYLEKLISTGLLSNNNHKNNNNKHNKNNNKRTKLFDEDEYNNILNNVYSAGIKAVKDKRLDNTLTMLLNEVDNNQDENAIRSIIKDNDWFGKSEYQINIAKHILVHLFIMTFLTIDEYRISKYIEYINMSNKNHDKLMKIVKGSFIYEWLIELGKALRVYNLQKFISNVANDILKLTENKVNMTSVGVIGGLKLDKFLNEKLDDISIIFEDFVSKSKYSKITYANDLMSCPSIKFCDNDPMGIGCDLYSHGYTTSSRYDMS